MASPAFAALLLLLLLLLPATASLTDAARAVGACCWCFLCGGDDAGCVPDPSPANLCEPEQPPMSMPDKPEPLMSSQQSRMSQHTERTAQAACFTFSIMAQQRSATISQGCALTPGAGPALIPTLCLHASGSTGSISLTAGCVTQKAKCLAGSQAATALSFEHQPNSSELGDLLVCCALSERQPRRANGSPRGPRHQSLATMLLLSCRSLMQMTSRCMPT